MRTSTSRTAVIAGIAASVTAVSACSGVAGGGDQGAGSGSTLNLLLVEQDSTKELQSELIPEFEASSGVKVNVELVPESGYDAKLATAVSSGTGQYDVIMTGAKNWTTLVAQGAIAPIDDLMAGAQTDPAYISGFPTTLLDSLKVEGKNYAMPYQVGAELLFFNKELLEEAGVSSPPTDMDSVIAAAKKVHDQGDADGFVGRGSREGNENSFLWLMMWFLDGGRWPEGVDPAAYDVLTQPEAVKATSQYLTLMRDYGPQGVANYGFAEAQLAIQQGEAAMWLDAAQLGPALEDESKSKIAGKVGYAALKGEGGEDYIVGAVSGFSITESTKDKDSAWKLVQFLTSKQTGVAQVLSGTNGSNGRSDVLDDPQVRQTLNPDFVSALKEAVAHTNPRYTPLIAQGQQIRGALALELSKSLSSDRSADETMSATQSAVQGLLK